MNELDEWTSAACDALGLDPTTVDKRVVLDLARDVAHRVLRPGAPLTAYLLGVAVGRGARAADAAATLTNLALTWPGASGEPAASGASDASDASGAPAARP